VVAKDDQPSAERGLGGGDPQIHLFVRQPEIALRQRLPLPKETAKRKGQASVDAGPRSSTA
jgi:hypothetical protein